MNFEKPTAELGSLYNVVLTNDDDEMMLYGVLIENGVKDAYTFCMDSLKLWWESDVLIGWECDEVDKWL